MIDDDALSADAIRAAHRAIQPAFTNSPPFVHDGLSARLGVPVIVISGYSEPPDGEPWSGMWLRKPIHVPDLHRAITTAIGMAGT